MNIEEGAVMKVRDALEGDSLEDGVFVQRLNWIFEMK